MSQRWHPGFQPGIWKDGVAITGMGVGEDLSFGHILMEMTVRLPSGDDKWQLDLQVWSSGEKCGLGI